MSYVYRQLGSGMFSVGTWGNDGSWQEECHATDREEAALRVHWLHGGCTPWRDLWEHEQESRALHDGGDGVTVHGPVDRTVS